MMIFQTKNNSEAYIKLNEYKTTIEKILSYNKYISKKEYITYYNQIQDTYNKLQLMNKEEVLESWCKKQKTSYKHLRDLLKYYEKTEDKINNHNDTFIQQHLICEKEYLDKILEKDSPEINLDEEQRKVVLSDEDYTLVIAGAGSGKTTTIEAKAKYLIEKQNVDPNKILIISFTKKATKELQDRFRKLNLPVKISTFHSVANAVISSKEEQHHSIASSSMMFSSIKNYMINNINDETFINNTLLFFASYLQVPFDENNIANLFNELNRNDTHTLKSDVTSALDNFQKNEERRHITIQNEKVRSIEECRIANFLFINGIDYEYEPIYKYGFNNTTKPYTPDFIIRQFDKEIYLEHFGISETGINNRFTKEELEQYKKNINEKILLHRKHNTKLIYTFSKYKDKRDTITHLKEELKKAGISLEPKNKKQIYEAILKQAEDKYFNKFIQLVCVFISRFKINNYPTSKFNEWKITLTDERTKLFIDICHKCYLAYMTELKNTNSIDFEDMINNSLNVINTMIKNNEKLPYDYIFVDEYQDISLQRFDLCEKLSKCSDAKIIAVGDDWQSIFKFTGAKIELFTKFEQQMGYANILKITNTYRNSQELIDIAGNFIMENDNQIKKTLKSTKSINNPITIYTYNDSRKIEDSTVQSRVSSAFEKSLDNLVKEYGENQKLLFIGRYGFEGANLRYLKDLFDYESGIITCKKYPKLKITYLTAHSSKGLGYDNVVIINAKDAILGFPTKIEDDPVMKLVIKDNDSFEYAEERRLFYVALTRTKNKVHIITPKYKPSKFILELKQKHQNIPIIGEELSPTDKMSNILKCPICGYPMQRRTNKNFKIDGKLWICSNDPEICGFITNDLTGGKLCISKCPKCEDGYLIVKTIKQIDGIDTKLLGCTNYKPDGTGCKTYILKNYTQDLELLNIRFYDEKTDINKVTICGHPFKETVNTILEVIIKYQPLKLSLGPKLLFSILSGKPTKAVQTYKLYNNPKFGYLDPSTRIKFYQLLKAMQEENIIKLDTNNYNKIIPLKTNLTEEDYKIIYASIKI